MKSFTESFTVYEFFLDDTKSLDKIVMPINASILGLVRENWLAVQVEGSNSGMEEREFLIVKPDETVPESSANFYYIGTYFKPERGQFYVYEKLSAIPF